MRKRSICIVCKKERKGSKVEDDMYLETMRKIKGKLNVLRNNTLVVCDECLPKAEEKRRRFEGTIMTFGVLATLMFVTFIILSPSLFSLIIGIIVAVAFMLLSLLLYYPKVEKHGKER